MRATFDAVSSARSSASEGKIVANKGAVVVGVESVGVQMVISAEAFRGCVRVRMTVVPDACSVYNADVAETNVSASWSRCNESLMPGQNNMVVQTLCHLPT